MSQDILKTLATLLPIFPLVGFFANGLFGKKLQEKTSGILGSSMILASFILSLILFLSNQGEIWNITIFHWFSVGTWNIDFAFLIDPLTLLMLLIVTGVGFLIHLYSIGYMHGDAGFSKFFSYLNLFVFFMLLLVLGNNYLIMFIGWEGVGACSYLLIGFWFKNKEYNMAAKKAFVLNRIGDIGFVLGMFMLLGIFGTLNFTEITNLSYTQYVNGGVITIATLLLFFAATGKSAQIPLFTWLPDAMAGPTPVSALIHAATMVTAGIYMITRSAAIFLMAEVTMQVILWIGVATSLMAAIIGMKQNDIKKVLAYSTVSQLGILFAALGAGAFTSAFFHLTTHAFFKALLFLGAGSVIHALGGEQDIRKMGGLKDYIKVTFITFLLGTIAISGIPPFSGFFSKDEILAHVFESSPAAWVILQGASLITVFYMFRLLYLVFYNKFRGTEETKKHIHESPKVITIPLIILATLSVVAGFIGMPSVTHLPHALQNYLAPAFQHVHLPEAHIEHATELILMSIAVAGAVAVILVARNMYVTKQILPENDDQPLPFFPRLVANKFYIDELYTNVFKKPLYKLSTFLYKQVDQNIFDKIVNGAGSVALSLGEGIRKLQHGSVGFYIFAMVFGIIILALIQIIFR